MTRRFKLDYENDKKIFIEDWERKRYSTIIDGVPNLDGINGLISVINELNEEKETLRVSNIHLQNELSWVQDCAYYTKEDAFDLLFCYYMKTCDEYRILLKQNKQLEEENDKLKNEINMLKVIIGRNEAYIDKITHTNNVRTSLYED